MAKKINIRGEKWKVAVKRLPRKYRKNSDAIAIFRKSKILISPSAKDKRSALIHEILHVCLPDFEEEAIEEIECAIVLGIELGSFC